MGQASRLSLLAPEAGTARQLTPAAAVHAPRLLRERKVPREEVRAQNARYIAWIEQRAAELAERHPQHADAFRAYVLKERQECEILQNRVDCATWLLRRTA